MCRKSFETKQSINFSFFSLFSTTVQETQTLFYTEEDQKFGFFSEQKLTILFKDKDWDLKTIMNVS